MTVEPCGNAKAHVAVLRVAAHHAEGRREPALVIERCRRGSQRGYCLLGFFLATAGQPGSQMGGLHGAGASAAQHAEPLFGEPLAQHGDAGEHGVGAQQRVASHDADAPAAVVLSEESVECHVDAVVVECPCQRLVDVLGVLAHCHIVAVDATVIAVGKRLSVSLVVGSGLIAFVEIAGVIETMPSDVEGNVQTQ